MQNFKKTRKPIYKLLLIFSLILTLSIPLFKSEASTESDCIICPQFVPDCSEGEKLILQTCKQCAHCEPEISSPTLSPSTSDPIICTKCIIHAQCPHWHKCTDGCCVLRPHRRTPDVVIKKTKQEERSRKQETRGKKKEARNKKQETGNKKQKIKGQKSKSQSTTSLLKPSESSLLHMTANLSSPTSKTSSNCKNLCGTKCCKQNEKCITVDQCKGSKGKCKLPILKYCSKKLPEKITGRLNPL